MPDSTTSRVIHRCPYVFFGPDPADARLCRGRVGKAARAEEPEELPPAEDDANADSPHMELPFMILSYGLGPFFFVLLQHVYLMG